MTAEVTRLPPREFYAVVPGAGGQPGMSEPVPQFWPRSEGRIDELLSAMELAKLLSANGSGPQDVTLTWRQRGKSMTRVIMRFEHGRDVSRRLLPAPYPTRVTPAPEQLREGSPHGHIPELCSTAKHRARGTRPRRNSNMPKPAWPGII